MLIDKLHTGLGAYSSICIPKKKFLYIFICSSYHVNQALELNRTSELNIYVQLIFFPQILVKFYEHQYWTKKSNSLV